MKTMNLPAPIKKVLNFTMDKSPELLSITAIGGLIATARKAYKCRPKCDEIINAKKKELENIAQNDTKARRKVYLEGAKELAPVVAPMIIMGAITIGAIVFANRINKKRLIAITTAYNLAEGSLKDLQNKMTETLGENKVRDIKDKIMKDKVDKNLPEQKELDELDVKNGTTLCFDSYSGRYFKSSPLKLDRAILDVSSQVMREMYVTLNEFYDILDTPDLPPAECGRDIGWRSEDAIGGSLPITISAQKAKNGEPCLCLDYNNSLIPV